MYNFGTGMTREERTRSSSLETRVYGRNRLTCLFVRSEECLPMESHFCAHLVARLRSSADDHVDHASPKDSINWTAIPRCPPPRRYKVRWCIAETQNLHDWVRQPAEGCPPALDVGGWMDGEDGV